MTAIIPVIAPALKISPITEHPLIVNKAKINNKRCEFFMVNV